MVVQTHTRYLTPKHHGLAMTLEEFDACTGQEGHRYELIDGRVYVSPFPTPLENCWEEWLNDLLRAYRAQHLEIFNYVSGKARVFVPGRPAEIGRAHV